MFSSALTFSFEHFSTLFCHQGPCLPGALAVHNPLLAQPCFWCCEPAEQHLSSIFGAFGSDSFRGLLRAGTKDQPLSQTSLFHYSSETCVMAFLASFASALSGPNANISHINSTPGCWDPGWACASCSCVPAWLFLWCQELVNSGMVLQPPELPLNKWEPQRAQCHGAKFCPSAHPGAGTGGI